MNNNVISAKLDSKTYKIPFRVYGHFAFLQELIRRGFDVKIDSTYQYACVCFDNTIDYNDFKTKMKEI